MWRWMLWTKQSQLYWDEPNRLSGACACLCLVVGGGGGWLLRVFLVLLALCPLATIMHLLCFFSVPSNMLLVHKRSSASFILQNKSRQQVLTILTIFLTEVQPLALLCLLDLASGFCPCMWIVCYRFRPLFLVKSPKPSTEETLF